MSCSDQRHTERRRLIFPSAKYVPQPQATRPPLKELLEQRVRAAQETDLFRSPTPELFIPQQEEDGEFDHLDVVIVPPEVQRPRMCVFYVSGKGCREVRRLVLAVVSLTFFVCRAALVRTVILKPFARSVRVPS